MTDYLFDMLVDLRFCCRVTARQPLKVCRLFESGDIALADAVQNRLDGDLWCRTSLRIVDVGQGVLEQNILGEQVADAQDLCALAPAPGFALGGKLRVGTCSWRVLATENVERGTQ